MQKDSEFYSFVLTFSRLSSSGDDLSTSENLNNSNKVISNKGMKRHNFYFLPC